MEIRRIFHISILIAAFYIYGGNAAGAQSNEVFLGQIGNTNTITIDQTGANNLVGGTTDDLRLNQLGDRNAVTILQVGENNGVGRINMVGQAGFLTGRDGSSSGLFQVGDGNVLNVTQRTARGEGGQLLGSILQQAGGTAIGATNEARVEQIGGVFDPNVSPLGVSTGPGFHTIGEILQTHRPASESTGANMLAVRQSGIHQQVEQFWQNGAENDLTLRQSGEENTLRMSQQAGEINRLDILEDGRSNTVGSAMQIGLENRAVATLVGNGNLVEQIVQRGTGNTAFVSIVGNDNGGEGTGGYRAVSAQATVAGAYASSLEQYGEGNALSLTIGSDEIGRADGNYFSAAQRGFSNTADSITTGDGNEFALAQDGDSNWLDITQASSAIRATGDSQRAGNIALLQQAGAGNRADLKQSGADNRLEMKMRGDRNQLAASQTGSGHRIDVRIVGSDNLRLLARGVLPASRADALAGTIRQDSTGHRVSFDIAGDANIVSILQRGVTHVATGFVTGNANWAAVRQMGEQQTLVFRQFGDLNSLIVRQE